MADAQGAGCSSPGRSATIPPDHEAARLGEQGALTPRVSRTFPLDGIVAAHAEAELGHRSQDHCAP